MPVPTDRLLPDLDFTPRRPLKPLPRPFGWRECLIGVAVGVVLACGPCIAIGMLVGRITVPALKELPAAADAGPEETVSSEVPLVGDETLLTAVKADPESFVDRPFVVTGGVEVDDYYNYGYRGLDRSYYSLSFHEVRAGDPQIFGERCTLYVRRDDAGKRVVDQILAGTAKGKQQLIRVKATLTAERYREGAWNLCEVLDVQFARPGWKGWRPWGEVPEAKEQATLGSR